jgi:hypothetical protein
MSKLFCSVSSLRKRLCLAPGICLSPPHFCFLSLPSKTTVQLTAPPGTSLHWVELSKLWCSVSSVQKRHCLIVGILMPPSHNCLFMYCPVSHLYRQKLQSSLQSHQVNLLFASNCVQTVVLSVQSQEMGLSRSCLSPPHQYLALFLIFIQKLQSSLQPH